MYKRQGSSIGVGKAKTVTEVRRCIAEAFRFDRKLVLEACVVGQEIEVAVFGDADGEVLTSCVGEIAPAQEFYTYSAKYDDEGSELFIPARIPEEAAACVRRSAERIFRSMSCFGLARVDFFLRADGTVVFNEINAIPDVYKRQGVQRARRGACEDTGALDMRTAQHGGGEQ